MLTRTLFVSLFLSVCFPAILSAQLDTSVHTFSRDSSIEYIGYGKMDAMHRKQGSWVFHYYKINTIYKTRIVNRFEPGVCGYTQTFADSGLYENDKRTGLWIHWNKNGKVGARIWYSAGDTAPMHIISYFENGYKRHEAERVQTSQGEKQIVRIYRSDDNLLETQIYYANPGGNLQGIIYTHAIPVNYFDENIYYAPADKHTYVFSDASRIDSVYGKNGLLSETKKGNSVTTYFVNGKPSGYYTHDTIMTWYDNGQPATQSVNLRNTGITALLTPGVINSYGVFRRWSSSGELLLETYDYPTYLPFNATALLGDDQNHVRGQGPTDGKGYKHGAWNYYAQDSSGNRWVTEKGTYDHGIRTGTWTGFHPNGKKKYETQFVTYTSKLYPATMYSKTMPRGDGDQLVIMKQKADYIRMRAGEIAGNYTTYYPNGNKQYEITPVSDDMYNGAWRYYDSTGKLLAYRNYRNGLPADSAWWCYPDGRLFQKMYYDSLGNLMRSSRLTPEPHTFAKAPQIFLKDFSFTSAYPPDPFEILYENCAGFGRLYTQPASLEPYKRNKKRLEKEKKKQEKMYRQYRKDNKERRSRTYHVLVIPLRW